MKKEFYDKPLYSISNYILGFIQSSFYFAICNILLILFFVLTTITPSNFNLLFLFISLIPLGPSIGALYFTVSKTIREKDIYFFSVFWKSYKNNFTSCLKMWMIQLIIITISFIDFQYFYLNAPERGIHQIFIIILLISLIIGLYSFPINSRFELKLKDVFLLSAYYTLKKFPITILKVGAIILTYFLANNISITFLFFMPCIICIIFYYYDRNMFIEIEKKFN